MLCHKHFCKNVEFMSCYISRLANLTSNIDDDFTEVFDSSVVVDDIFLFYIECSKVSILLKKIFL